MQLVRLYWSCRAVAQTLRKEAWRALERFTTKLIFIQDWCSCRKVFQRKIFSQICWFSRLHLNLWQVIESTGEFCRFAAEWRWRFLMFLKNTFNALKHFKCFPENNSKSTSLVGCKHEKTSRIFSFICKYGRATIFSVLSYSTSLYLRSMQIMRLQRIEI